MEEVHHPGPAASVCTDHHPDQLRRHLAVHLPPWLVILPDWIYDLTYHSLHKLLHSDLQQKGVLPEERTPEGAPERLCVCSEWPHQQLLCPRKQCEAEEAAEGLRGQGWASVPCCLTCAQCVAAAVATLAYTSVIPVGPHQFQPPRTRTQIIQQVGIRFLTFLGSHLPLR